MKALVGAFNQEKALVGAFSVIVKTDCETDGALLHTVVVGTTETSGTNTLTALHAATLQYPTPNFLVAGHDTMQNTAGRVKTFETLWGELRMKFVAYRIGFNSTLSFKDGYQDTS